MLREVYWPRDMDRRQSRYSNHKRVLSDHATAPEMGYRDIRMLLHA